MKLEIVTLVDVLYSLANFLLFPLFKNESKPVSYTVRPFLCQWCELSKLQVSDCV